MATKQEVALSVDNAQQAERIVRIYADSRMPFGKLIPARKGTRGFYESERKTDDPEI